MAAVVLAVVQPASLRAAAATEAQVKAAYLFKMASFVRWPDGAAGGAFRVCVAGRGDIAGVLEQLARNQLVEGRRMTIARIESRSADQARSCQILFLGRGGDQVRQMLAASRRAPVLTVTDRAYGSRGGAIEFVMNEGRVRFVIDRSEAESRMLVLNSKLLEVAAEVTP